MNSFRIPIVYDSAPQRKENVYYALFRVYPQRTVTNSKIVRQFKITFARLVKMTIFWMRPSAA